MMAPGAEGLRERWEEGRVISPRSTASDLHSHSAVAAGKASAALPTHHLDSKELGHGTFPETWLAGGQSVVGALGEQSGPGLLRPPAIDVGPFAL